VSNLSSTLTLVAHDCRRYNQDEHGKQNPKLSLLPHTIPALQNQEDEVQEKGQQYGEQDDHGSILKVQSFAIIL